MEKYQFNQNICWACQNACGGCSWSQSLTPVEGWEVEEIPYMMYHGSGYTVASTYHITKCPEFVQDEPRVNIGLILTEEENKEFMKGRYFKKFYADYHTQE